MNSYDGKRKIRRTHRITSYNVCYTKLLRYSVNNIGNTIFQYAYSYKYKDNEQSSWSPISGSVVPYSEDDKDFPNNLHTITLKSGGSSIKKILIAARKGEDSDFLLIDTLDKEKLSIDDDVDYEYEFYNNKATISYNFV